MKKENGVTLMKRSVFCGFILTLTIVVGSIAAIAQNSGRAIENPEPPTKIEAAPLDLTGTWLLTITPDDGSPSFTGYYTFFGDGNVSFSSAGPPIPALGNPGYGVWKRTSKDTFAATIRMNSYDLAFQFAGTLKINTTITMSNADNFKTKDAVFVYDPDGNEIVELAGSAQGKRMRVEE